jgi:sugar/nucleoside kinase (ribokinase family)
MKTVFNPAPMTSEIVQKFSFDKIDVIIVNQIEFEALVQGHNIELSENIEQTANSLLSHPKFKNCKLLVITLGSSGVCYLLNQPSSSTYKFSQLPVIPPPSAIKDTTGAGDTFIGHFIANLAKFTPNGEDICSLKVEEVNTCAKFGMAAASIGITEEGAMNSIPDREQVVKLLAANGEQLALFPPLKLKK